METVVAALAIALVCVSLGCLWLCSRFLATIEGIQADLSIQRFKATRASRILDDGYEGPGEPVSSPPAVNGNSLFEPVSKEELRAEGFRR